MGVQLLLHWWMMHDKENVYFRLFNFQSTVHKSCRTAVLLHWLSRNKSHPQAVRWSEHPLPSAPFDRDHRLFRLRHYHWMPSYQLRGSIIRAGLGISDHLWIGEGTLPREEGGSTTLKMITVFSSLERLNNCYSRLSSSSPVWLQWTLSTFQNGM